MGVGRIFYAGWLARCTNTETMQLCKVYALVFAFRNAATNDAEIIFQVTAGSFGIDKGCFAGHQLLKPDKPLL
jgi:hypothetical protein